MQLFWRKYKFLLPLAVMFAAFQNFGSCTSQVTFRSDSSTKASGNGEPTDAKPGSYYRFADGFTCKGKPSLIGQVSVVDGQVDARVLDEETCQLTPLPVANQDLEVSRLDSGYVTLGNGIYKKSDAPISPAAPPASSLQILCTNAANEVLVRTQGSALTLDAAIAGSPRLTAPVSANRKDALSVQYVAGDWNLTVDRTNSLLTSEVAGRLSGPGGKSIDLLCRAGGILDVYNHFAPEQNFEFFGPTLPAGFTLARASAGTYYASDGRLVSAAAGAPRFTHDPASGLPAGLLIETAAANLFTFSDAFANWEIPGYAVTSNTAETVSPTGGNEAELFRNSNVVEQHQIMKRMNLTPGAMHTFSVYIKPAAANPQRLVRLQIIDQATLSNDLWASFDIINGTVDLVRSGGQARAAAAGVERLRNGWLRIFVSGIPGNTAGTTQVFIESLETTMSTGVYADPNRRGFYLFGAQLEENATATSYIATGAAVATRAADSLTSLNPVWWQAGSQETTLMVDRELSALAVTRLSSGAASDTFLSLWSGAQRAWSLVYDPVARAFHSQLTAPTTASVTAASDLSAQIPAVESELAVRSIASYGRSNFALTVNGEDASTAASVVPPVQMDRLDLAFASAALPVSHLRAFRYWPYQLTTQVRQPLSTGIRP